jgi:hypothetical protein
VAKELDGPGARPDFTYAMTYERDLVVRAATALLRRSRARATGPEGAPRSLIRRPS